MSQPLAQRIKECTSLPTLPAAAIAVLQLAENDKTGVGELADVIAQDPALSSKLLRVVNSGFYGLQQKVVSIRQAAALLGLHSVRTLVLGFSLANRMQSESAGFDHLGYWRRSMYAATAARTLAAQVLRDRTEEC